MTYKIDNFSVLWLNWSQTMEMKQNLTFFDGTYSNLPSYIFFIKKYWSILMTFKIKISQFYDWSELKQWKWNKLTRHFPWNIFRSDNIFPWLQSIKIFQWLLQLASFNFNFNFLKKPGVKSNSNKKKSLTLIVWHHSSKNEAINTFWFLVKTWFLC